MSKYDDYQHFIFRLSQNEIVIESEKFKATNYLLKERCIGILTANNGMLSVYMDSIDDLIEELKEIKESYGNLNLACVKERNKCREKRKVQKI